MSLDDPESDEEFTSLLAACDEAVAAGERPTPPGELETSPEQRARLERGLACIVRLQRLRPPRDQTASAQEDFRAALLASPTTHDLRAGSVAEPAEVGFVLSESLGRLGRFEIRRELGRGGFGVVF